jgi:uncharacterized membrane protein YbhN (UPF0104 family)
MPDNARPWWRGAMDCREGLMKACVVTPFSLRHPWLLKGLLAIAITAGLVLLLLRFIEPGQIGLLMRQMDWRLYGLTLGLWIVLYFLRTARFLLLAPQTPFFTMFCISSVYNLLLRLLPLRSGELSYGFLVKRAGTAGFGESLLGLLLIHIFDAIVVVIIFSMTLALDHGTYQGDKRLGIMVASGVALAGLLVVFTLRRLLRFAYRLTDKMLSLLRLAERPWVKNTLRRVQQAIETFQSMDHRVALKIFLLTVIYWLVMFGAFYTLMQAWAMPVGVVQTVLGSTGSIVTGFLPIGGIGTFGTLEAGWALGFSLVGLPRAQAILSAFGVSLVTFTYSILLGLLGWLGLYLLGPAPKGPYDGNER